MEIKEIRSERESKREKFIVNGFPAGPRADVVSRKAERGPSAHLYFYGGESWFGGRDREGISRP